MEATDMWIEVDAYWYSFLIFIFGWFFGIIVRNMFKGGK